MQLFSPEGLRTDGRRESELRFTQMQIGTHKMDGSSVINHGNTTVLCNIEGPRELGKGTKIICKRWDIQQAIKKLVDGLVNENEELIIYLEINGDGGVLHTCINAVFLALIDAGIPIKDYISACSAGKSTRILLDCNYIEEQELGLVTVAMERKSGKIVLLNLENRVHVDDLPMMIEVAKHGCMLLAQEMENCIRSVF